MAGRKEKKTRALPPSGAIPRPDAPARPQGGGGPNPGNLCRCGRNLSVGGKPNGPSGSFIVTMRPNYIVRGPHPGGVETRPFSS